MTEINILLLFMIAAALIAVQVKDLLSSVVAIGAVGIGLSMAFLVLKAPDLAMMQLVVEIISLIILVRATIRKDLPFSTSGRWFFNTLATTVFVTVFLVMAYLALLNLPGFGSAHEGLSKLYIDEGAAKTGMKNVVAAINLNYRLYDTLGEAVMIFTAVIGVLAIARKTGHERNDR